MVDDTKKEGNLALFFRTYLRFEYQRNLVGPALQQEDMAATSAGETPSLRTISFFSFIHGPPSRVWVVTCSS